MADTPTEGIASFSDVFCGEIVAIAARRKTMSDTRPSVDTAEGKEPSTSRGLVGLSLSGGGIRSAAFCLGVLQGLEVARVLPKADYISTVSGGGYVGGATILGMSEGNGKFPLPSELGKAENPNLAHLRDFSGYLVAGGVRDTVTAFANIVAGVAANTLVVLPIILLLAGITIAFNPTRESLRQTADFGGLNLLNLDSSFVLSIHVFLLACVVGGLALFALARLWDKGERVRQRLRWIWATIVAVPLLLFFIELQPAAIAWLWDRLDVIRSSDGGIDFRGLVASAAAILTTFSAAIGRILRSPDKKSGLGRFLIPVRKALLYLAVGLVVPLLLWLSYLTLSMWGIVNSHADIAAWAVAIPPPCEVATQAPQQSPLAVAMMEFLHGRELQPVYGAPTSVSEVFCNAQTWLAEIFFQPAEGEPTRTIAIWVLYVVIAAIIGMLWFLIPANAYSLHYLYRDRIVRTFLFFSGGGDERAKAASQRQLKYKLSDINTSLSPYLLINAALNIHGSREVNQRGRNADFFLFTPKYVGSKLTGYCQTEALENKTPGFDLGAAMTISGAAASASVGARVNAFFVFSLALLNIRLGYWLLNPRLIAADQGRASRSWGPVWFLREAFGRLRSDSDLTSLSDGGHLENLGLYELLRRRCAVIIVVDAESDPDIVMPSFVEAQRYARIDLGIRIDLEWDMIAERSKNYDPKKRAHGPHAAMGLVHYDDAPGDEGEIGLLIYLKASASGDEADYVREYKRRYPKFPHESTLDQFFGEAQFEAYRALGFHIAHRLFNGEDEFQGLRDPKQRKLLEGIASRFLVDHLGIRTALKCAAAADETSGT